ncbi:hypothetical protein SESBI_04693 [Sesbania bispinosa]|nr:hypothetical protein SESBI_04693 [Sesbania bispinosa]
MQGACSELINWEACDEKQLRLDKPANVGHAINITKCAIEKMSQIGVLAANHGGNSVNILNVSWKGVVSLLQIGGGRFTEVNVADIVVALLALITEPLKVATEAWSSSLNETISITEAKRIFVPVKFYLINAVKICSLYPCQTYKLYREITHCVLMITSFSIFASTENLLKCASAVITELLEETTLDLLLSLLNSDKLKLEQKHEVLEWLFINGESHSGLDGLTLADCNLTSVNESFTVVVKDAALSYDTVSGVETDQERFMFEFRAFLNKEIALLTVAPSPEQLELLRREGLVLKQMVHKISVIAKEKEGCQNMEVDDKNQSNKKGNFLMELAEEWNC